MRVALVLFPCGVSGGGGEAVKAAMMVHIFCVLNHAIIVIPNLHTLLFLHST